VNVTQLAMASNCIILLHKVCHPMIESWHRASSSLVLFLENGLKTWPLHYILRRMYTAKSCKKMQMLYGKHTSTESIVNEDANVVFRAESFVWVWCGLAKRGTERSSRQRALRRLARVAWCNVCHFQGRILSAPTAVPQLQSIDRQSILHIKLVKLKITNSEY
jgi:hypothetical protein